MTTIDLHIDINYLNLLNIFAKANELDILGFKFHTRDVPMSVYLGAGGDNPRMVTAGYKKTLCYSYDETNEELTSKITYMALVHAGFENMLKDYIMKVTGNVVSI